jgi:segregation and condensation protein A
LPALALAYVAARRRAIAKRPYRPKPRRLWSVQEAIQHLSRVLAELPSWGVLTRFLPAGRSFSATSSRAVRRRT